TTSAPTAPWRRVCGGGARSPGGRGACGDDPAGPRVGPAARAVPRVDRRSLRAHRGRHDLAHPPRTGRPRLARPPRPPRRGAGPRAARRSSGAAGDGGLARALPGGRVDAGAARRDPAAPVAPGAGRAGGLDLRWRRVAAGPERAPARRLGAPARPQARPGPPRAQRRVGPARGGRRGRRRSSPRVGAAASPPPPRRDLRDVLTALDQVAFATAHGADVGALAQRARALAAKLAP